MEIKTELDQEASTMQKDDHEQEKQSDDRESFPGLESESDKENEVDKDHKSDSDSASEDGHEHNQQLDSSHNSNSQTNGRKRMEPSPVGSSASSSSNSSYSSIAAREDKGAVVNGKPQEPPHKFRGRCLYQSRKCENERALKRNGKAHNLCEEHRSKQNQHQRKFDAKKFSRKRRKTADQPVAMIEPRRTMGPEGVMQRDYVVTQLRPPPPYPMQMHNGSQLPAPPQQHLPSFIAPFPAAPTGGAQVGSMPKIIPVQGPAPVTGTVLPHLDSSRAYLSRGVALPHGPPQHLSTREVYGKSDEQDNGVRLHPVPTFMPPPRPQPVRSPPSSYGSTSQSLRSPSILRPEAAPPTTEYAASAGLQSLARTATATVTSTGYKDQPIPQNQETARFSPATSSSMGYTQSELVAASMLAPPSGCSHFSATPPRHMDANSRSSSPAIPNFPPYPERHDYYLRHLQEQSRQRSPVSEGTSSSAPTRSPVSSNQFPLGPSGPGGNLPVSSSMHRRLPSLTPSTSVGLPDMGSKMPSLTQCLSQTASGVPGSRLPHALNPFVGN